MPLPTTVAVCAHAPLLQTESVAALPALLAAAKSKGAKTGLLCVCQASKRQVGELAGATESEESYVLLLLAWHALLRLR